MSTRSVSTQLIPVELGAINSTVTDTSDDETKILVLKIVSLVNKVFNQMQLPINTALICKPLIGGIPCISFSNSISTFKKQGSEIDFEKIKINFGTVGLKIIQTIIGEFKKFNGKVFYDNDKTFKVENVTFTKVLRGVKNLVGVIEKSYELSDCFLNGYYPEFYWDNGFCFKLDAKIRNLRLSDLYSQMVRKLSLNLDSIKLPSGTVLSKETFLNHSFFKSTKEKDEVFLELYFFTAEEDFSNNYTIFLKALPQEDWYKNYQSDPLTLAVLSLIAFFDNKIDQEELFVINLIADILNEKIDGKHLGKISIHTLTSNNAADYLKKAGYLPFATDSVEHPMIRNCKTEKQLEIERENFLQQLVTLSPVKRTVGEYTLSPFKSCQQNGGIQYKNYSLERGVYFKAHFRLGYKDITQENGTIVLLSPMLIIDLLRKTSSISSPLPSEHYFMFGYSDKIASPFYRGVRVLSIPSPLFDVPYVHNYSDGPKSLQLYFHDLCYHMALELNNPHIPQIVGIVKKLKDSMVNQSFTVAKVHKVMIQKLLDREVHIYRYTSPRAAFMAFLSFTAHSYALPLFKNRAEFTKWNQTNFYPLIMSAFFKESPTMVQNQNDNQAVSQASQSTSSNEGLQATPKTSHETFSFEELEKAFNSFTPPVNCEK